MSEQGNGTTKRLNKVIKYVQEQTKLLEGNAKELNINPGTLRNWGESIERLRMNLLTKAILFASNLVIDEQHR
ncbi:hypothetical protein [Paenibacillus woosongensis]|uniref:Uncharacterized protein n=1 Tax=Paenibacillus woosongensis TaxID=307580 RepID=A0A7X2Z405_9BACL|nr:hypothetical protein [Paenibacillus woosongensis]MUG47192.1 hypothetical protein [Paenibacillus woosongensis]